MGQIVVEVLVAVVGVCSNEAQGWTRVSKAARENVRNGPKLNVKVIFLLYPRSQVTLGAIHL